MRILGCLLLLICCCRIAEAQPSPAGSSTGLTGPYVGNINGTPATLTLQQQGASLSGIVDASGYRYTLTGTVDGGVGRGTVSDPQAGGAMEFELAAEGNALTLTLLTVDPFSGQTQHLPVIFQRSEVPQPDSGAGASSQGEGVAEAEAGGDPSLVGAWGHSDTYTSGDFSSTTRVYLQVNPDGTYLYGNGRVTMGGANDYGSYSGDTGNSGDVTRGLWRTQGNIVYVKENGMGPWVPYARYYVEGGSMLFTFGDGSRQLWTRQ